jgi:hypothetical protein
MFSRSFRRFFNSRKTAPINTRSRLHLRPTVEQLEAREVPALSTVTQFTPGNLVVLQAGDGVTNENALPLYLDEFTTAGTQIQQAIIPNTQTVQNNGAGGTTNQPITIDGTAAAGNGQLNRSLDGSALTFSGMDANPGSTTQASAPDRVVAQLAYALQSTSFTIGYSDPTVTLTTGSALTLAVGQQITVSGAANSNFDGTFTVASVSGTTVTYSDPGAGSPGGLTSPTVVAFNFNTALHGQMSNNDDMRGAVETNTGTGTSATVYTADHNPDGGALFFSALKGQTGATPGTLVSQNTNVRGVTIGFDGRLYWTSASGAPSGPAGVYTETTPLPTSKSPTDTLIAASTGDSSGKLGGIYLADTNGDGLVDEGDRLYFVDDGTVNGGTTGGLYVSVYHNGAWGSAKNITPYTATGFNFSGPDQMRGLTGVVISTTEVKLYVTTMDGINGDTSSIYLFDDNFATNDGTNEGINLLPTVAPGTSQGISGETESGNTVTITTSSALGLAIGQQVVVSGASVTGYNGIWTITAVSGNTFQYNDPTGSLGNDSTGTASTNSGTVTLASMTITDLTGYRGVSLAPVAPTTATLTINGSTGSLSVAPGTNLTFSVALTSASGIPVGNVVLRDGNTVLPTTLISIVNGVATFTLTGGFANGGIHNISAYYSGGAFAAATSNTVTVTQDGSTTSANVLTANINPTTVGKTVTLTDTITGDGTGGSHNPTGNVVFMDGSTVLGNANLTGGGNAPSATLNVSFATTGSHSLKAIYGGNTVYASNNNTLTETVNSNVSVSVTSSQALAVPSATPTYTATVTGFTGANVDGTIQFFVDGAALGSPVNLGPTGKTTESVSITSSSLTAGSHFITVAYTPTLANTPYQSLTTTNATALIQYAQQAFAPGDLVVVRRGDGSASLGSANTLVFLDEINSLGQLVQSIAMPNTDASGTHILGMSGTAGTEGQINLSVDGRYLTLGGFDTLIGTPSITGTTAGNVKRTVARVDALGNIDTSTTLASADGAVPTNIRSVASTDGSQLWVGSDDASSTADSGINYATIGSSSPTQVGPNLSTERDNAIYYGQLYASTNDKTNQTQVVTITATGGSFTLTYGGQTTGSIPYNETAANVQADLVGLSSIGSGNVTVTTDNAATGYVVNFVGSLNTSASALTGTFTGLTGTGAAGSVAQGIMGIEAVGSGLPTGLATLTQLPGLSAAYNANLAKPDPFAFLLTSDTSGASSPDICYIADQTNGLVKFGLVSGTWTFQGSKFVGTSGTITGLTGVANFSGSTFMNVTIWATGLAGGNGNPGPNLYSLSDTHGANGSLGGSLGLFASAGTNETWTGVAFAPTMSSNGSLSSGNLVVTRVGESSAAGRASGDSGVYLDQYTTAGSLVNSISLTTAGNNLTLSPVTQNANSASVTGDGFLYQSSDGHTLELGGYYVPQGGSTSGAVRMVAVVSPNGTINYTTQLPSGDEGTIRGAISADGNGFWITGSGGLRYVPFGNNAATSSTKLSSYFGSLTSPALFGDQLLVDGGAGAQFGGLVPALDGPGVVGNSANTFLPSTPAQPIVTGQPINPMGGFPTSTDSGNASAFPTSNQFVFLDQNTVLVADGRVNGNGGIYVYYQNGGNNWVATSHYTFANSGSGGNTGRGLLGMAVTPPTNDSGTGTATVYATTIETSGNTNQILKFDVTGIGGTNPSVTLDSSPVVATSAPNQQFRGIAFAPTAAGSNSVGSNSLTITPGSSASYGASVTFKATLTGDGSHGTPTGIVAFRYGNVDLGTATINGSGVATFVDTTNLPAGIYDGGSGHQAQIVAVYTGDTNYAANTSSPASYTISQATTTTTVTVAPNPVGTNVQDTFTATIVPAHGGAPTGTVQFADNGTNIGTPQTLNASVVNDGTGHPTTIYTATLSSSLTKYASAGTHNITATYIGDNNFAGSNNNGSPTVLTVMTVTTPTIQSSNTGTVTLGNTVTFTAVVPNGSPSGSQAGTVNFYDNQLLLSASVTYSTVNTNDLQAVITLPTAALQATNSLTPGIHTITVQFVPSNPANYYVSNGFLNQKVSALAFTANDALVERVGDGSTPINQTSGNSIYVDEYTPPSSGTTWNLVQSIAFPIHDDPSGTNHALVSQAQQSTTGALTLSGNGQFAFIDGFDVNIDPTIAPSANDIRGNTQTIGRIKYDGTMDTGVAIKDSGATGNVNSVISQDGNSFYLVGVGSGGTTGAGVRYMSTYTQQAATQTTTLIASNTIGGTNNGLVGLEIFGGQLYVIGGSTTGTLKVGTVGSGIPTTTGQTITELPGIPTSTTTATAPYFPVDAYFTHLDGSSAPAGINTVYIADDGLTFGTGAITKWALVSGSWTKVGEVDFSGNNLGFYWLQGQTTTNGSGATTGVKLFSTYGNGGGGNTGPGLLYSLADTNGYNQSISSSAATLIASDDSSTNMAFRGVAFTPENNVTGTALLTASPASPQILGTNVTFTFTTTSASTGTVYFFDNTTALGTPQVLSGGTASVSSTTLALGSHTIYAYYTGDATHDPLSASIPYTIQTATTTTLSTSVNPAIWGQVVTLSATVANNPAGGAVATGTVTFKDNGTTIGTGTLNGSGVATLTISSLSVGTHSNITAVYGGDSAHQTSTSSALSQTVNTDPTSTVSYWTPDGTTFNQNTHSSTFGAAVTFSAWVFAPAPGLEPPTGNVQFQVNGSNLGSPVAVDSAGVATITFSSGNSDPLPAGTDVVTAIFAGSTNYAGSSSVGGPTQIVSQPITISSINVDGGGTAPIINATESSNTVTITTDGPHGFSNGDKVLIYGVGTGYDGSYQISNVTSNTFQYTSGSSGLSTVTNSGTATDAAVTSGGLLSGGQRSMVDSIVYVFNQAVTVASGGFTIAVHSGGNAGGTAPTLAFASPDGGITWVVTFTGSGVNGNSIANGAYDITLDHTKITANSGGGSLATSDTETFYSLYGDTVGNGHMRVNGTDVATLNGTFGLRSNQSGFLAYLDSNDDGRVNGTDLAAFNGDFGVRYTGFTPTI